MERTHLLIIDPQNDFCDLPLDWLPQTPAKAAPTLPVPGAHRDMLALAGWLDAHGEAIDAVTVTLDHHHRLDIAHPGFWKLPDGAPVGPFTQVKAADLREGRILTARGADLPRAVAYLEALERENRFVHMVWPVHCQIGTWGQAVHAGLQKALDAWEDGRRRAVAHVLKGENPWTEHYSALRAEIPVAGDPATGLNRALLEALEESQTVFVGGEAGSHCVKATVDHLVAAWNGPLERIVLLRDAMSPVGGFEAVQEAFLREMADKGLRVLTLAQAAALL